MTSLRKSYALTNQHSGHPSSTLYPPLSARQKGSILDVGFSDWNNRNQFL